MLGQFSWEQFFYCYGAFSLLWYLGLLFTAYRKEVMGLVGSTNSGDGNGDVLKLQATKFVPDSSWPEKDNGSGPVQIENSIKEVDKKADEGLMGKVNLPAGVARIETGGLAFVLGVDGGAVEGDSAGKDGSGLYEELTAGIREIYGVLASTDGNKQDFFGMVGELKAEIGAVGSSPCIPKVNAYIRDSAPFAISSAELESLWD